MNEGLRKLKQSKKDGKLEKSPKEFIGDNNSIVLDSTYIAVK